MGTQAISPETVEERIVWHTIRATYVFYLFGAIYIVAPVVGWTLLLLLSKRFWKPDDHGDGLPGAFPPVAIWLWMAGMLVMLIALIVGHLDFSLSTGQTIKSSIGWAKGWALLAIFPLLGCLSIRPQVVYRAAMHVCLHTLLLLPLFIGAWLAGLPQTPYVSPLNAVGGPGPEFFALNLYEIDPGSGRPRWRLFTPWAPALGFVANIYFIFALQERSCGWRITGIIGSTIMVLMSGSRLAILALVSVWGATWLISRLRNPLTPFVAALGCSLIGLLGVEFCDALDFLQEEFRSARVDSSRVRDALGRIAVQRWSSEAPVWGHGVVERGPHLVEFMPIGSHHSWYGLLFVKGIVGALALGVPLVYSLGQMAWWSGDLRPARVGLSMVLLLLLYTFGENLEVLAYLIWPALMVIGMAHRDAASSDRDQVDHSRFTTGE